MNASRPVLDFQQERLRREGEAWTAYASARKRAEETLTIEDGIAAGKAWKRWLDLFMTGEQTQTLEKADKVVRGQFGARKGCNAPPSA
jgi:hypothetical protein